LSIHIPQISVDPNGDLIPNPGENIMSVYKPVEHDNDEGELYVTDSRLVWIGTKAKRSFLGKIAKAAVLAAAVGASAIGSRGRSMGLGMGAGMIGGMMGGLGVRHMVSKNPQGQPQTVSLPYEVMEDDPVWNDDKEFVVDTHAGSLTFKFERAEDADAVATQVKEQIREVQRRSPNVPPQNRQSVDYTQTPPPQYVPPPPPSGDYHYCPHCGTPLNPGAQYCHNCGERLH
jgi:membrane protease subunit (stomatin/prohibitin family)